MVLIGSGSFFALAGAEWRHADLDINQCLVVGSLGPRLQSLRYFVRAEDCRKNLREAVLEVCGAVGLVEIVEIDG